MPEKREQWTNHPTTPVIQVHRPRPQPRAVSADLPRNLDSGVDDLLGDLTERGAFRQQIAAYVHTNTIRTSQGMMIRDSDEFRILAIGGIMEDNVALLKAVAAELEQAREAYQSLSNEVQAVGGIIRARLFEQTQELRSARMTAVSETQLALTALRDVRTFFLESDYELEITRLERFVVLCRELMELKQQGVLDAVCDSALRLAVSK